MALARFEQTLVDDAGNILSSATVTVRRETSGTPLARLYSDRAGTLPMSNPVSITPSDDGFLAFHVSGGVFRIDVVSGSYSKTRRYVGIGTAQEQDANQFNLGGLQFGFETGTISPPGDTAIRFNTATIASATEAYIDYNVQNGTSVATLLAALDPGTRSVKNKVLYVNQANGSIVSFDVDSVTDVGGTSKTLALSNGAGDMTAEAGDVIGMQPIWSGYDGGLGSVSVQTSAGPFTVSAALGALFLNKAAPSATAVTLGPVAARSGRPLHIVDYAGNAGDITITPNGTEKIMGLSSLVLGSSAQGGGTGASIWLYPDTTLGGWTT